jgi:hypothetical protein
MKVAKAAAEIVRYCSAFYLTFWIATSNFGVKIDDNTLYTTIIASSIAPITGAFAKGFVEGIQKSKDE